MKQHRFLFLVKILLAILLLAGVVGGLLQRQFSPSSPIQKQVARLVKPYRFDLIGYELRAILSKSGEMITRPGSRLSPDERRELVRNYISLARETHDLQFDITRIYADPNQSDPAAASAALQQRLTTTRTLLHKARPMAESILERQVSRTLEEEGLGTAGVLWPPLLFNFSALPNYLVVSTRDRIELVAGVDLRPDLDVSQKVQIEDDVASAMDVSTLVEELGGLGVWPTMVSDDASLSWVLDTVAHEWTHTYMAFHALGWHMFDNPQMDTINETVATIVGEEVGAEVGWRYYGIPKPKPRPLNRPQTELPPPNPNKFDFQIEMHRTRVKVDALLKAGKIAEAESYMEARRKVFVEHGYAIRKLNQAYFAFHGTYATTSASTDPIGPKLRELRTLTPDLATFVHQVQRISKPEDLDALLQVWRTKAAGD